MPFTVESILGLPPIGSSDTVAQTDLGRKVSGRDPLYGYGEFIYIKATAAIAAAQPVVFDQYALTGVLAVTTARGLVGVAPGAIASGSFGWVQVFGEAPVTTGTVVADTPVFATAVAGTLDDAVSATNKIDGASFSTANGTPVAGQAVVQLAYPAMNGNG